MNETMNPIQKAHITKMGEGTKGEKICPQNKKVTFSIYLVFAVYFTILNCMQHNFIIFIHLYKSLNDGVIHIWLETYATHK